MKSPLELSPPPDGTLSIHDAARLARVDRHVIQAALDSKELSGITFIRRVPATAITVESFENWINRRAAQGDR